MSRVILALLLCGVAAAVAPPVGAKCTARLGLDSFDLLTLGVVRGLDADVEAFEYAVNVCANVKPRDAAPFCSLAPAPAIQITPGACLRVGSAAARSVRAPSYSALGVVVELGGGEPCDATPRSMTVEVACADVPKAVAGKVTGGHTCAYAMRVAAREGCPLSCARDAGGAVCGGAGRGECVGGGGNSSGVAAACKCTDGHGGPACAPIAEGFVQAPTGGVAAAVEGDAPAVEGKVPAPVVGDEPLNGGAAAGSSERAPHLLVLALVAATSLLVLATLRVQRFAAPERPAADKDQSPPPSPSAVTLSSGGASSLSLAVSASAPLPPRPSAALITAACAAAFFCFSVGYQLGAFAPVTVAAQQACAKIIASATGMGGGGGGSGLAAVAATEVSSSSPDEAPSFTVDVVGSDASTISTSSEEPPLLVIYGDLERYWGSYAVKHFIAAANALKSPRYGWKEYLPWSDNPRDNAATMESRMLQEFGRMPDVLLFLQDYDIVNTRLYPRTALNDTKYLVLYDDTMRNVGEMMLTGLACADLLLPTYEYLTVRMPSVAHIPRVWQPHSALPAFALPYNPAPVNTVLLVGAVMDGYPLRQRVAERLNGGDTRFEQFAHPGWQPGKSLSHIDAFARAMQEHIACILDATVNNFVVAKVFEVPAVGALLLMSDDVRDGLEALGLFHGEHYLSFNASSLDETVNWVLAPANRLAVDTIRAAGQALVHAQHMTLPHRVETIHAAGLEAARVKREGGEWDLSFAPFPNYDDWPRRDSISAEIYLNRRSYPRARLLVGHEEGRRLR